MKRTDPSEVRLTSGEVSRRTGLPLQTLIRWDRSHVLTATGRRSSSTAPRRYDENGLVAALFGRWVSRMGFTGSLLARMVRLMQTADRKTLRRWFLYSYRGSPGLVSHDFQERSKEFERHIETLRKRGALIDEPTDLWTIREGLIETARGFARIGGARQED
jgi:DNA-binding transcriptional MerR regulator